MKTSIKSLKAAEAAPVFNWLTAYAFTSTPPIADPEPFAERISHTESFTNFLALYEGDTPTASAAAGSMIQNIRGELVDMAGIFMVASHPNYRRKGYSFKLLRELLKQERESGHGFSCLYPFRESFYERLGYANLPGVIRVEFNIRALQPLLNQTFRSKLEMVEFVQQPERYFEIVELYKKRTHGAASFKKNYPPDPARHKSWVLRSELDGQPDGVMAYSLQGDSPTQFKFNATRFYPFSADSRYHFLEWIARHIDQASEVSINLPPYERPASWFNDLELKLSASKISPMGRVLDIEQMNGLNADDGVFRIEIIDPSCPWNEGAWVFEGRDGKLTAARTQQAEHQMTIQGLSALVYGSLPPGYYKYRGWGNIPADLEKSMLDLFPPAIPYLHESF